MLVMFDPLLELSTGDTTLFAFFGGIGTPELIVAGLLGVLLFGHRLPSVARSMGKSFIEFKKGMQGFQDELNDAVYNEPERVSQYEEPTYEESSEESSTNKSPRFQPPQESTAPVES